MAGGTKTQAQYTAPSSVVIFSVLIFVALMFDRGKRYLFMRCGKHYQVVVHAFFEEISTFGFVSLVAFIFEKDWNGQGSILYMVGNLIEDGYGSATPDHFL